MLQMCCISQEIWSTDAELQLRVETKGGQGGENMKNQIRITSLPHLLLSVTHSCGVCVTDSFSPHTRSPSFPVKHRNVRCLFSLRPQVYLNDISGCRDNSRKDDNILLHLSEGGDLDSVQNESWGVKKKKILRANEKRQKDFKLFLRCSVFFDLQ